MKTLVALFFLVLGLFAPLAVAQSYGANPAHPNADLTVNGVVPDAFSNDLNVAGAATLNMHVASAAGTQKAVIFLAGTLAIHATPTPWGGSIDLGGVSVIADGYSFSSGSLFDYLAFTPFDLNVSIPAPVAGGTGVLGSLQAVVVDPTNTPLALRNSIAIRVAVNRIESTYAMGDDSYVAHTLSFSSPVEFMGASHTTLFVGSNGFVTFGAGSTANIPSTAAFFTGLGHFGNAAVAVAFGDMNPTGAAPNATYRVIETTQGVTVEFRNQVHYASFSPAGTFSCTFPWAVYSDVRINLASYIPGPTPGDAIVVGITDGDTTLGVETDLSNMLGTGLSSVIGTYASPAGVATDSIAELIPGGVMPGASSYLFWEMGASFDNLCRFMIYP